MATNLDVAARDADGCGVACLDRRPAAPGPTEVIVMPALPAPVRRAVDVALEATVVLSFSRVGYEVRSRLDDWIPTDELPGTGQRALITGANSGLGYATARALLRTGAEVRLLVRSEAKGEDTLDRLSAELGRDVRPMADYDVADLADLASVRAVAERILARDERLDVLIHNAGAMFDQRSETEDGLERTYQVHVVGPFLLTSLLLPKLAKHAPTRVVTVTSGGMYAEKLVTGRVDSPGEFKPTVSYARAKRAQVALTNEWARRFGGYGIDFHVMHPGWALTPGVESSLPGFRKLTGPILRDADQGSDTIVYLALADADELGTGRLWHDRRPRSEHKVPWTVADRDETARLWARVATDAGGEPSLP
jgi:dehydrogenase/reductase SDR family member 12